MVAVWLRAFLLILSVCFLHARYERDQLVGSNVSDGRVIAAIDRCNVRNASMTNGTVKFDEKLRPHKIILTTSYSHFPLLLNWLIYYQDICPNSMDALFIICLDHDIESRIRRYGLTCSFVHYLPNQFAFNRLWLVRGQQALVLMQSGHDVLLCDSDALWLRNPFPDIEHFASFSDIVASRAKFPEEFYARLGATLCMGFVYVKATRGSQALWTEATEHMVRQKAPDDQYVINDLLVKNRINFGHRLGFQRSFAADTGRVVIQRSHELVITLLPQSRYRRFCPRKLAQDLLSNATIVHCVTIAKSFAEKRDSGHSLGLWQLNDSFPAPAVRLFNASQFWSYLQHARLKPLSAEQRQSSTASVS